MKVVNRKTQQGMTTASVVASLVIVAALLFVFFPRPSCGCKARQVSCSSNERQIGLALLQYAQDNDERFPTGTQTTPGLGWAGQVYPYIKSLGVFRCPDDKVSNGNATVSYAYNADISVLMSNKKHTLGNFVSPAHSVVLFEVRNDDVQVNPDGAITPEEGARWGARRFSAAGDGTAGDLHSTLTGPDPIHYATGDLGGRPRSTPDQFSAEGRHTGRSNFLFADGHVKLLGPEKVSTGANAPTPAAAQTGTTTGTAAGTGNRAFVGTFSLR